MSHLRQQQNRAGSLAAVMATGSTPPVKRGSVRVVVVREGVQKGDNQQLGEKKEKKKKKYETGIEQKIILQPLSIIQHTQNKHK